MMPKRTVWILAAGAAMFVAIASVPWSKVVRVTMIDGGVQKENLILGKFTYTSISADPSVKSTPVVARKLAAYGLAEYSMDSTGVITQERGTNEYDLTQRKRGDIRKEASNLLKKMPWLSIAWRGKRSTSFYARGTHPSLGGKVAVACSRMPERKHGPNLMHITATVIE
jgi:hypothetical protein